MKVTVLSVVLVSLANCSVAESQQLSLSDLSAGVSFGYVWSPSRMFSNAICPDDHPSAYRFQGALSLTELFFVSVGVSHNTENPALCYNGLVHPIPDEGPYTARFRVVDPAIPGYPFATMDFQVGVHAESQSGDVRAGVGPVWFLAKDLMGTKAAVEVAVRIRDLPFAVLIGFDQTWLSIPYVEGVFQYQDGQLVESQLTPRHSREQVRVLRLGVEVRF
ncbi:MAG: hypothetical protein KAJ42_17910 [Gemmatimonadetes bacterium]|nr:hypothetical protein [Gemmatimonadota bacterium]